MRIYLELENYDDDGAVVISIENYYLTHHTH